MQRGASRPERKSVSVQSGDPFRGGLLSGCGALGGGEAIYAQGREAVVDALVGFSVPLEGQDAQLATLAERVEELEQRLKRDSRNSSLPPSHNPPWLGKRGRSRGTGRKQGGQPGHTGHGQAALALTL